MKGCGRDDVEGIGLGVEHGEAVMMLGGDDDVFHPGRLGEGDDVMRIERRGVELRGESLVVLHRNGGVVHDPFANARDLLAVPGAGRDGVKTPVDEHAEACISPPGHACVTLRGGLGILNRGHGMSGRDGDMLALYLGE